MLSFFCLFSWKRLELDCLVYVVVNLLQDPWVFVELMDCRVRSFLRTWKVVHLAHYQMLGTATELPKPKFSDNVASIWSFYEKKSKFLLGCDLWAKVTTFRTVILVWLVVAMVVWVPLPYNKACIRQHGFQKTLSYIKKYLNIWRKHFLQFDWRITPLDFSRKHISLNSYRKVLTYSMGRRFIKF